MKQVQFLFLQELDVMLNNNQIFYWLSYDYRLGPVNSKCFVSMMFL